MEGKLPLVSVGIPTYNRPDGLRRTLECIVGQTYPRLEIIVSDNASDNPQVKKVAEEFAGHDTRITYICQERNLGPNGNFRFTLANATGEYFMWAADDDEWDKEFIRTCVDNMGDAGSVMTNFTTHFNKTDMKVRNQIPFLTALDSTFVAVSQFLENMQPSLFYGLHRRVTIQYFLRDKFFDFYDCYFVIRQVLEYGFVTIPNKSLYTSGIDSDAYVVKPATKRKGKLLDYLPFLRKSISLVIKSKRLKVVEKIKVIRLLSIKVCGWFIHYETGYRPASVFWVKLIRRFLKYWEGVSKRRLVAA
jgi:glycosyltransferase involved in cell wall biosynthesis